MRTAALLIIALLLTQTAIALSIPATAIKPLTQQTAQPLTQTTVQQRTTASTGSPTETACTPQGSTKCEQSPFDRTIIFQQCIDGSWVYKDRCQENERCDSQKGCIQQARLTPPKTTPPALQTPTAQRPTTTVPIPECRACDEIQRLRSLIADLLARIERLERQTPRCAGPGQNPTTHGGRCCPGLVADSTPRCGLPGGARQTCAPQGTRADMYGRCCEGLTEQRGICTSASTTRTCAGPERAPGPREGCCPGLVITAGRCQLPPADERGCADMNLRPELYGGQCCEGLLEVDGICTRIDW